MRFLPATNVGHPRRTLPPLACLGALLAALLAAVAGSNVAQAQKLSEPAQGLREATPRWHALTGIRLVLAPGQVVENGTLVMRDGVIVAAGAQVAVPAGARVWPLAGRTVYAGFVDMASGIGQTKPDALGAAPRAIAGTGPILSPSKRWVRPEFSQASALDLRADDIKTYRELGFTTALSAPTAGIFRGQSALLSLRDGTDPRQLVLASDVAQHLANEFTQLDFEARSNATIVYPTSLMGSIALVRQTWLNARWYATATPAGERREFNASLQALAPALAGKQAVIYEARDEQDYARIAKVRDEFKLRAWVQGNGYEYRRAAQLKAQDLPVIVPLNYPGAPEVEQPESALDVSLQQLQHWERAPSNLAALQAAGVTFALSTQGLKDAKKDFWPRLRQAVKRGLPADAALAALTTTPAKLLGAAQWGRLTAGQMANVVVANGDLFTNEQAEIELSFVDGQPYATEAFERFEPRGSWQIVSKGLSPLTFNITGTRAKPSLQIDGKSCELQARGRELLLRWPCDPSATERSTLRLEGRSDALTGALMLADGRQQVWTGQRTAAFVEPASAAKAAKAAKAETLPPVRAAQFPAGVFGREALPTRPAAVVVRNATLWTSAAAGRLEATDLLVRDGKISAIGRQLAAPDDALVIDAAGRHVTPGIIDAHSHTAITRGINEFAHSVTAEVRIGDIIDATDISMYRQLAGGVTAANVLHGSANTIGGQNQVIKLRWGAEADALKFEGAKPGIKFALGENVKRANFPDAGSSARYPVTRMGVEQVLRDSFLAARTYQAEWAQWRKNGGAEPRRDLQMDTLVELLERRRVIHIHSYRADEILMFVQVARDFGLEVATFQHVLEGYKVAKEIASIGAGASGFSDWWTYKVEVQDAIPYSGAMTHRAGVLTSFNSDSDELARRLNTEAAKAVRYGGLSEEEALKFVTINPARQLRIESRVGSLEVGKDADFVLWSAHPLSTSARVEQTWIDGRRFFDQADDAQLRERDRIERVRLMALALPARAAVTAAATAGASTSTSTSTNDTPAAGSRPPVTALGTLLETLELQRWLHDAGRYQDSYWGGSPWHECTGDAQ